MAEVRQRKPDDLGSQNLTRKKVSATTPVRRWNISYRFIARVVVITALLIVVWYARKPPKHFAKQNEIIDSKVLIVSCSDGYEKELKKFEGCAPKECKRIVSDKFLLPVESGLLLLMGEKILAKAEPLGGAAIFDVLSGALSKGQNFINFYKMPDNRRMLSTADKVFMMTVREKLRKKIASLFQADPSTIYMTRPAFFSELTNKTPITMNDEYWHTHVDKETYGGFHYTCLVYLNDYGYDFTGGRFIFDDKDYSKILEPRTGRVSIFTSGEENKHHIEPVKSGVRYALTIAFTCDKKYAISDPEFH